MGPEFFWFGGMWIFPVIGIIVMLFVVYMIFGRGDYRGMGCGPWRSYDKYFTENKGSESALEILSKRYATGEITKEEFERMKKDILS